MEQARDAPLLRCRSANGMVNALPTLFRQRVLTTCRHSAAEVSRTRVAFFNVRTAEVHPDRRVARRYVVDCPARFTMAGGDRDGRLSDLSQHGARLETASPPVAGTTGFLRWNGEEHYCTVIWSSGGRCGFKFERPIALGLVEATCSRVEVTLRPVAAVGRIPLGQRRSGRFVADD